MRLESTDGWVALGVSVVGTSHVARGVPCQDAHAGVVLDDGTMLLAVADGAGSARFAAEGAPHAVQTVIGWVASELAAGPPETDEAWRGLLMDALARTRVALEDLAAEMEGAALRDFATTLLLAVITRETLATLQVGDGAIVLRSASGEDKELHVLTPQAVGEYVNETTFCEVTSEDAVERVLIAVNASAPVDAVSMFTDGVQFLAVESRSNLAHGPFFAPLFAFAGQAEADPEELTSMLSADRVNELTDDDKTLVLAVRVTQGL